MKIASVPPGMDAINLGQIKDTLLDRKARLLEGSGGSEMVAQEPEMVDMAQALEQLDRDRSLREQERRELLAIERALAKLASGDFGTCDRCEEEIPPRRLLARPEASLCARCQSAEERAIRRGVGLRSAA